MLAIWESEDNVMQWDTDTIILEALIFMLQTFTRLVRYNTEGM